MLRNYAASDAPKLLALWNTVGVQMGYVPLPQEKFSRLLLNHPAFSPDYTFLLEENHTVVAFANGCIGENGDGYISCLLASNEEQTQALLTSLEAAFRSAGCKTSRVSFFGPIRLPWVIPGTDGHQHNNVPGVWLEHPLYDQLLRAGYRETSREIAMYLKLSAFSYPQWVEEKAYTVAQYDPMRHKGLTEMVQSLGNAQWSAEIPAAGREGKELLVGLLGDTCAGFAGPIYPEETGRGYFSGIGVAPEHQGNGLGTLLFYRLLQREKELGAEYMSLFTGEENPARRIYSGAGFTPVRKFAVMEKPL